MTTEEEAGSKQAGHVVFSEDAATSGSHAPSESKRRIRKSIAVSTSKLPPTSSEEEEEADGSDKAHAGQGGVSFSQEVTEASGSTEASSPTSPKRRGTGFVHASEMPSPSDSEAEGEEEQKAQAGQGVSFSQEVTEASGSTEASSLTSPKRRGTGFVHASEMPSPSDSEAEGEEEQKAQAEQGVSFSQEVIEDSGTTEETVPRRKGTGFVHASEMPSDSEEEEEEQKDQKSHQEVDATGAARGMVPEPEDEDDLEDEVSAGKPRGASKEDLPKNSRPEPVRQNVMIAPQPPQRLPAPNDENSPWQQQEQIRRQQDRHRRHLQRNRHLKSAAEASTAATRPSEGVGVDLLFDGPPPGWEERPQLPFMPHMDAARPTPGYPAVFASARWGKAEELIEADMVASASGLVVSPADSGSGSATGAGAPSVRRHVLMYASQEKMGTSEILQDALAEELRLPAIIDKSDADSVLAVVGGLSPTPVPRPPPKIPSPSRLAGQFRLPKVSKKPLRTVVPRAAESVSPAAEAQNKHLPLYLRMQQKFEDQEQAHINGAKVRYDNLILQGNIAPHQVVRRPGHGKKRRKLDKVSAVSAPWKKKKPIRVVKKSKEPAQEEQGPDLESSPKIEPPSEPATGRPGNKRHSAGGKQGYGAPGQAAEEPATPQPEPSDDKTQILTTAAP